MQNDQEIFSDNAVPFNTIKLLSVEWNGCVKQHIVDIAAQTVQKESQLSAQQIKSVIIVQQNSIIQSIALSNDTHTLFVANHNGNITQFQKEESSLNYYPVMTFKGHTDWINSISLSNSKMHLLSASRDQTLRVWDLQNGTQLACLNEERKEHQSSIFRCCWNDKDTLFASGGSIFGDVVVWSPPLSIYNTSNHFIPQFKFFVEGFNSTIQCLKFQENGLDLFASYFDSRLILWGINEKELLDNISTKNATLPLIGQPKRESEQYFGVIFSFDVKGCMLIVGVDDEILPLSADSLQSMADSMKFEQVHDRPINSLVFSKDGKYVASGSENGSVAIFDSKSGKCVKLIKNAHSDPIEAVLF